MIRFPFVALLSVLAAAPAQAGFTIPPESEREFNRIHCNIEAARLVGHLVCETLRFTDGDVSAARETVMAFVGRWRDQGVSAADDAQRADFFKQLFVSCDAPGAREFFAD